MVCTCNSRLTLGIGVGRGSRKQLMLVFVLNQLLDIPMFVVYLVGVIFLDPRTF